MASSFDLSEGIHDPQSLVQSIENTSRTYPFGCSGPVKLLKRLNTAPTLKQNPELEETQEQPHIPQESLELQNIQLQTHEIPVQTQQPTHSPQQSENDKQLTILVTPRTTPPLPLVCHTSGVPIVPRPPSPPVPTTSSSSSGTEINVKDDYQDVQAKTLKERREEYVRARARIFNEELFYSSEEEGEEEPKTDNDCTDPENTTTTTTTTSSSTSTTTPSLVTATENNQTMPSNEYLKHTDPCEDLNKPKLSRRQSSESLKHRQDSTTPPIASPYRPRISSSTPASHLNRSGSGIQQIGSHNSNNISTGGGTGAGAGTRGGRFNYNPSPNGQCPPQAGAQNRWSFNYYPVSSSAPMYLPQNSVPHVIPPVGGVLHSSQPTMHLYDYYSYYGQQPAPVGYYGPSLGYSVLPPVSTTPNYVAVTNRPVRPAIYMYNDGGYSNLVHK